MLVLAIGVSLTTSAAFAQDAAAPASEAPKAQRLRVIVLDLKGGGLDPAQLEALSGYVTVSLSEYEPLEVLSGADVRAMVELEGEKQAMGCESDTSCLAEIAGAMGARLVVFGQIAKLGSRYVLNLSLFDSEAGTAVGRTSMAADALDGLIEQMPAGIHKLVGSFLERQGHTVVAPAPAVVAARAAPTPPPTTTEASEGNPFAIVLPLGALTLGAGLVGGGVALDLLLPTSQNKDVDGMDFLPASMYVAAAGAGIAGVVLFFANPLE